MPILSHFLKPVPSFFSPFRNFGLGLRPVKAFQIKLIGDYQILFLATLVGAGKVEIPHDLHDWLEPGQGQLKLHLIILQSKDKSSHFYGKQDLFLKQPIIVLINKLIRIIEPNYKLCFLAFLSHLATFSLN